jgi:hypothetical protein
MRVAIGKSLEMDVPAFDTLTAEVQAHIIYTGWRNLLQDSHAGKTGDAAQEAAERKLSALTRGELRTAPLTDPVAREAMRLATDAVKAKAKAEGLDLKGPEIRTKATANLERFMAKARKNLKEQAAIEVDL